MANPDHHKDIQKVHTFAEDVKRLRQNSPATPSATPKPQPPDVHPNTKAKTLPRLKQSTTTQPSSNPPSAAPPKKEILTIPTKEKLDHDLEASIMPNKQTPAPEQPMPPQASTPEPPPKPRAANPRGFKPEDATSLPGSSKKSLLTTEDDIFDIKANETTGEGSIVTDTKRNRFRLIPAIIASLKSWFSQKQAAHLAKEKARPTVARSSERADIIKAAAARSAMAPRDDYRQTSTRLKEVPRTAQTADLEITAASETPEPRWTYTTDEQLPPDSSSETPNVDPTSDTPLESPTPTTNQSSRESVSTSTEETAAAMGDAPQFETVPAERPVFAQSSDDSEEITDAEPLAAENETDSSSTATAAELPETPDAPEEMADPEPEPAPESSPELGTEATLSVPQRERWYRATPTPTPTYNTASIVAVSVVAVLLGIATAVWWFGHTSTETNEPTLTTTTSVTGSSHVAVPLPATHETFMSALDEASVNAGAGITQFYPTITTENGSVSSATTEDILTVLDPQAPGSFVRTIDSIGFGTADGSVPFIVLRVSSYEAAFGGMLEWERALSSDLAPWFGPVVNESFDRSARTVDSTRGAFYSDTVIGNRDARVLYDKTHTERVIYSFIDRTTILITTSPEAFATLAPQL